MVILVDAYIVVGHSELVWEETHNNREFLSKSQSVVFNQKFDPSLYRYHAACNVTGNYSCPFVIDFCNKSYSVLFDRFRMYRRG